MLAVFASILLRTASGQPANKQAAPKTKNLYKNLVALSKKGTMFGHQDDLAYGVEWRYEPGRSDVKDVTGDYPAVYGWELGNLELDSSKNLDGVPFSNMRQYIIEAYQRGAVITLSWHINNPLTGKNAWDPAPGTVTSILPGGAQHEKFVQWLDKGAAFINSLQTASGEMIPVLFRPYHELTGNWFWWCQNVCSADEFKQLWNYTITYLQQVKKLNNLLYVYNTAEIRSKEHFMERYPGDDKVDIVSFDSYRHGNMTDSVFYARMNSAADIVLQVAAEHNKLAAIGETGYETIPDAEWWTKKLFPIIKNKPLSYVLFWRNHGKMKDTDKMHYYVPFKGDISADDFVKF